LKTKPPRVEPWSTRGGLDFERQPTKVVVQNIFDLPQIETGGVTS
jgi:hypothetical protein